ncbi:MAG: glycosyltransferase family 4 protein [Terracidiphilus sp.]|nr:glycosyltransferase family 4 protein [Terracidiphilus sp.]
MRVLVLHNRYQFSGGEDVVVRQETEMLRASGVEVCLHQVDNDSIIGMRQEIGAAIGAFYSYRMRAEVSELVKQFRPNVMHVHNFMPRLTPSVYDAGRGQGCAVVQTLHNYRFLCANAVLLRNGRPCQDCVGRAYGWPGIIHRCYRESAMGSAIVGGVTSWHRMRGTWRNQVDRYIVLTQFARELFAESGVVPAEKIVVKPNAVPDSGIGAGDGRYLLYVGRLSPEKGIKVLLQAALHGEGFPLPLTIVGGGPLQDEVERAARSGRIEYRGNQSQEEVRRLMKHATLLLFPSLWYETFGMVIAEALASGLPVVASRLGAMAELICSGENGLLVEPGSSDALVAAVRRFISSPQLEGAMRENARESYEQKYTIEANRQILLRVYEEAQGVARTAR